MAESGVAPVGSLCFPDSQCETVLPGSCVVRWARQASKEKGLNRGVGDFIVTQGWRGPYDDAVGSPGQRASWSFAIEQVGLQVGAFPAVSSTEAK